MQRVNLISDMKAITEVKLTKKKRIQLVAVALLFLGVLFFCVSQKISLGQKFYRVYINGVEIGCVNKDVDVKQLVQQTRRELASECEYNLCMDYELSVEESSQLFTSLFMKDEMQQVLREELLTHKVNGTVKSYAVSIEGYHGNFSSIDEALVFFNRVKDAADEEGKFTTTLAKARGHISGILTASLVETNPEIEVIPEEGIADFVSAGVSDQVMYELQYEMANPKDDSYEVGLLDMEFIEEISVYERYILPEELCDLEEELVEVTKQKETNKIYVVQSGDCLSVIAYNHDMKVSELMALNEFDNENVPIMPGDEMIVAVPEPDLSLRVMMGVVYEEDYEEDPIIIPNDSWYTTTSVTLEEGTTGHRERNDMVTYENGIERDRELIHQTIMVAAKPAVIERGTIKPPTYIKPISGGRFTSGFGRRWGRMHKGVDWAVPVGTTIYASSAGTVVSAGYGSGYGYNVLLSHPDGRMTRYAHCSKLLVSVGQSVEQGQSIALSGNTGRSTGPHLHFEIYINGSQVNPLDYLN